MGMLSSKEVDPALKAEVERIKSCMYNHACNVSSIEADVKAQNVSAQILFQKLSESQDVQNVKNEMIEKTAALLNHIQDSLNNQVSALSASFNILNGCIEEISKRSSSETESPSTNIENINTGSQMKADFEQDSPVNASNRHSSREDTSKRGAVPKDRDKEMIKKLKTENSAICKNNNDLQRKLNLAEEVKTQQRHEIDRLLEKEKEAVRVQHDKRELENRYAELENENKRLGTEILKLRRNKEAMYSLQTKLERSEKEREALERTKVQLKRQVYDLEEEKRKIKERKIIVPVQLVYHRKDELMTLVVNELSAMLDTQMQTKGMQVDIIRCENLANIHPDKPILVLCINSSRLGTDASTAIEGVQKTGHTALLIFHHKNIHALPNQPSDRMLTSSEFKQLGGIVDLAFLTGKGIYPCDMNNIALSYIEGFIQRISPGNMISR